MTDKTETIPIAGAKPFDARAHDYECQSCGRGIEAGDEEENFIGLTVCASCALAECYEIREA